MPVVLGRGASLGIFMADLVALEEQLKDELGLSRVYRWRPVQIPELPSLWNWLGDPSTLQQMDLALWRDAFLIQIRVGVEPGDDDERLAKVEEYVDGIRAFVDPVFAAPGNPLQGAAREAVRTGIRTVVDYFNEIPVLCVEADLRVRFDRIITPTT